MLVCIFQFPLLFILHKKYCYRYKPVSGFRGPWSFYPLTPLISSVTIYFFSHTSSPTCRPSKTAQPYILPLCIAQPYILPLCVPTCKIWAKETIWRMFCPSCWNGSHLVQISHLSLCHPVKAAPACQDLCFCWLRHLNCIWKKVAQPTDYVEERIGVWKSDWGREGMNINQVVIKMQGQAGHSKT